MWVSIESFFKKVEFVYFNCLFQITYKNVSKNQSYSSNNKYVLLSLTSINGKDLVINVFVEKKKKNMRFDNFGQSLDPLI